MKQVTIQHAKKHLSRLVAAAEAGEDVVIVRDGWAAVRIVPVERPTPRGEPGALAGQLVVTPAFFEPLPEAELSSWER